MQNNRFLILKLFIYIQSYLCSCLIAELLVEHRIIELSDTWGWFLFQFVLITLVLTSAIIHIFNFIEFIISTIFRNRKRKECRKALLESTTDYKELKNKVEVKGTSLKENKDVR